MWRIVDFCGALKFSIYMPCIITFQYKNVFAPSALIFDHNYIHIYTFLNVCKKHGKNMEKIFHAGERGGI